MIDVVVFSDNSRYIGLKVSGHAGYGEEGRDIVCAAVSILTLNMANSVERFTDDDFVVNSYDGCFDFTLNTRGDKSGLLLDSCIFGLMDIGEEYSDFIKINLQEVK